MLTNTIRTLSFLKTAPFNMSLCSSQKDKICNGIKQMEVNEIKEKTNQGAEVNDTCATSTKERKRNSHISRMPGVEPNQYITLVKGSMSLTVSI